MIERLHASEPQPLPFAPSLHVRSFALERDDGNLLVYGAETAPALDDVERRYLGHWHEAMFAADLDAPTFVHARDRAPSEQRTAIAGTFSGPERLGDFELIPIPGHTPGATAFLWDTGDHRLLFTGDSIYLDEDEWVAAFNVSGVDRSAYVASLERLRELEFDVLVPWAATAGHPFHADAADAQRRIGAILDRVQRGEDR